MKNLVLIGQCIGVSNSFRYKYTFHFIGVYRGHQIKKVRLSCKGHLDIKKNDELLLYLKFLSMEKGVLFAEIIRHKVLLDLFM